jgi:ribose transport system permease protein
MNKSFLRVIGKILKDNGIIFVLILLLALLSVVSENFLTYRNISMVLRQVSVLGIVACSVTFVLIAGNFDLSVGSLISLCSVIAVNLNNQFGPSEAIVLTMLVGLVIGFINGLLIGYLSLNSLIVTLAMLSVLQAFALIYTGGEYNYLKVQSWYSFIGKGFLFNIPFPVIIFGVGAIVLQFILTKTIFGKYVFYIGSNNIASIYSGIKNKFIILSTYLLSGLTSAIAAIILTSRISSAQNFMGKGYELEVLAGIILGGASLYGGSGSIFKTVIGIMILGFIRNGLILLGLPYYSQWIAIWIIIILAVWINIFSRRGKLFI